MATIIGFSKLKLTAWTSAEDERLYKYFRFSAADWTRKSLSGLRKSLRDWLFINQIHHCAYCRHPINENFGNAEVDHIIPKLFAPQLAYSRFNLILACKRCNHRKHDWNPTIIPDENLWSFGECPKKSSDYVWVHPYIHKYEEHITLVGGSVYAPTRGSARGKAVIKQCRLGEVKEVVARIRHADAVAAVDDERAIYALLSKHPSGASDAAIAKEFLIARPSCGMTLNKVIEGIRDIRLRGKTFRRPR